MADTTTGTTTNSPKASDLMSVRSRVSWGAIAAGAMVALAVYFLFSLLGLALSIEVAVRGTNASLGTGAIIYSIVTLLLAMFFGGWTTSRLAVGESKLEAVLYGVILWGLLFSGMLWLVSAGVRTGFGAVVGVATGATGVAQQATASGSSPAPASGSEVVENLRKAGVEIDEQQAGRVQEYYDKLQNDPAALVGEARARANEPEFQQMAQQAGQQARRAAWWSLLGVLVSMATVIFGSLVGSGELLQPVPILGVQRTRTPTDPRVG